MEINWEELARLYRERGTRRYGSDEAMIALEIIVGEDTIRKSMDYYIDLKHQHELARQVLWRLRPASGMASGKYGFPTEIADDPVLGMVLADGEQFEAAEERRLFYVALTRARKYVYLVSDAAKPSAFIREILADDGYEKVLKGDVSSHSNTCPQCQRGQIVKRDGDFGVFFGCSNYPICTYRGTTCPRCKRGRMSEGERAEARCDACDFAGRVCPQCQKGVLSVRRNRRNGNPFWGCSMFGRQSESCDYTDPIFGKMGGETPPAVKQVRHNGSR